MSHFQVLFWSIEHFSRGLPVAFGLAVACLLVQIGWGILLLGAGEVGVLLSVLLFVFAHIWFVLFMSGWHLRCLDMRLAPAAVARRALGWAVLVTGVLGVVIVSISQIVGLFGPGLGLAAMSERTMAALGLLIWAGFAGSGLSARLMVGGRFAPISEWGDWLLAGIIATAPWAMVLWILGSPFRNLPSECCGLFEGGIVFWPLLGGFLFCLSASTAALSAAVHRAALTPEDEAAA